MHNVKNRMHEQEINSKMLHESLILNVCYTKSSIVTEQDLCVYVMITHTQPLLN